MPFWLEPVSRQNSPHLLPGSLSRAVLVPMARTKRPIFRSLEKGALCKKKKKAKTSDAETSLQDLSGGKTSPRPPTFSKSPRAHLGPFCFSQTGASNIWALLLTFFGISAFCRKCENIFAAKRQRGNLVRFGGYLPRVGPTGWGGGVGTVYSQAGRTYPNHKCKTVIMKNSGEKFNFRCDFKDKISLG